jgi:LacI family transcriptional regulator
MSGQPPSRDLTLPTMKDVARLAGVSRATVSFVVNGRDGAISDATRARVRYALDELGYRPNRTARNLKHRTTATIGFVNHEDAANPFSGLSIAGAHDYAWKHGIALLVVNTARDPARLRAGVTDLIERRVDAILFSAVGTRRATLPDDLRAVPTVLVNCYPARGAIPCVLPADTAGGYATGRLLLDAGHRDIAYLAGKAGSWATRARVSGFRQALREYGIDPHTADVRYGTYRSDSGYDLTREVLASGTHPSAVLCGNDRMAMGAYLALARAGLRVPQDVSVVGYDDQGALAAELRPALTTVRLPYYEMGWWAAEHAVTGGLASVPPRTYLPCEVVSRASVAAPGTGRLSVVRRPKASRDRDRTGLAATDGSRPA